MAVVTGLAIAAAAVIGKSVVDAEAKKKASKEREKALNQMETINPGTEQAAARRADKERFEGQLQLQRDSDPQAAALRDSTLTALNESVDTPQDRAAAELGLNLARETRDQDPRLEALRVQLLADAKTALDSGAELPPEFQAELVRSGLEQTGRAGLTADARGAAGQTARRYLGAAAIALQEQRRQRAISDVSAAQDITKTRAAILGSVIPTLQNIGTTKAARALAAGNFANNLIPEFGLTGREMVGLDLRRIDQKNAILGKKGDERAIRALAQGEMISGILGAVGSFASGYSNVAGGLGAGGAGKAPGASGAGTYPRSVTGGYNDIYG